jgi:uncharacterized membrane protein
MNSKTCPQLVNLRKICSVACIAIVVSIVLLGVYVENGGIIGYQMAGGFALVLCFSLLFMILLTAAIAKDKNQLERSIKLNMFH